MARQSDLKLMRWWWKLVLIVIAIGVGYAAFISLKWDTFLSMLNLDEKEYTEKDILPCQAGTHQEFGKCVTNRPGASTPDPGASDPAPTAPKSDVK